MRFATDLSESQHRKLFLLAMRLGRKKADIVRVLLEEVLKFVKYRCSHAAVQLDFGKIGNRSIEFPSAAVELVEP
ncbi:MAG: hypothetical protein KME26_05965 [Oscillatoria princeps RMCB-10]|nr:hypothetical protein [Oscillatoria princeps RMCB-10]